MQGPVMGSWGHRCQWGWGRTSVTFPLNGEGHIIHPNFFCYGNAQMKITLNFIDTSCTRAIFKSPVIPITPLDNWPESLAQQEP